MSGGTTGWATIASGKKASDCLNLPLGFFYGGILFLVVEATNSLFIIILS